MGEEKGGNPKSCERSGRKQSKKKKLFLLKEEAVKNEEDQASIIEVDFTSKSKFEENGDADEFGKEQEMNLGAPLEEDKQQEDSNIKTKKKQRLLEEASKADQRGICYLSRIPPRMDPVKLRHVLSHYGEIKRIYLAPEDTVTRVPCKQENRKRDGGFQEQGFSEGWVEFSQKSVAKRVANMLNSEQIGGRKRSSFYYDIWNIKYLSKFKWDDLTAEIAYKNAIREQKLALEISAAKRERDFYFSKVDKSRALSSIEERLKRKQKVQQESQTHFELPGSEQAVKVNRQFLQKQPVADNVAHSKPRLFLQKQPVADNVAHSKPRLSKDILAVVFGAS